MLSTLALNLGFIIIIIICDLEEMPNKQMSQLVLATRYLYGLGENVKIFLHFIIGKTEKPRMSKKKQYVKK